MTEFIATLTVACATVWTRAALVREYRPHVERRVQEQAQGLPRGALAERWRHDGNGLTDDAWLWLLRHMNHATRIERDQLLRQR